MPTGVYDRTTENKRRYQTVKGRRPVYKVYHNTRARGENGHNIRAFVDPVFFPVDPWCGCIVVWAPMAFPGQTRDMPMVLKFRYELCSAIPRH